MRARAVCALALALAGCPSRDASQLAGTAGSASEPRASAPPVEPPPSDASAGELPGAVADASPPEPAAPSYEDVRAVLFADRASPVVEACPPSVPPDARVRCLYDERYRGDARAAGLAYELLVRHRIVAGVEVAHTMDGGYRGMIRIEPAVPTGAERRHLAWVVSAMGDFEAFFDELERHGRAHPPETRPTGALYRFRPITLRFMRSVKARTPTAYAHGWTVAYNLSGSLLKDEDAARETMFHEIFHLNDAARGGWSPRALGAVFDAVAARCGTRVDCLAPYTPNDTKVRGGTYYSFQPGNGVVEYAAELALRYYREQRAALRGLPRPKAFKCGPPENARAWVAMRDAFFGGIDATPPC